MMSLVARTIAGRIPLGGAGALKATAKPRVGLRKSPRSLVSKFAPRRSYTTEAQSEWSSEDLSVLGTYVGTPTVRGQKKTSTGLAGLAVLPEARQVLIELYRKFAQELTKMPKEYAYRVDMEDVIQRRLSILLEETDVLRLEEEIDDGQLESIIEEVQRELNHDIPSLLELKPWNNSVSKWDKAIPHVYSDVNML